MNILNLVKITPLLISSVIGINKANITENIFSFSITRTSTAIMSYTIAIKSKSTVWPNAIFNITFQETNNTSPSKILNSRNFNTESTIQGTTNLQIDVNFIENIDLQSASITENGTNPGTAINEENNSLYFVINPLMFETNKEITYTINADTNPIEPEPPEDPYKDFNTFNINQSRLQVIRTNKNNFSSYNDISRFNTINIDNEEININFEKYQYATLNYTNKNIIIPILGTFINNNTQYNIIDFYFTDNNNVINLLNYISSTDMFFASPTREVNQSTYTYKNSTFNYFNNQANIPYKLNYTKTSNSTIQITTNDVGSGSVGNATITNNQNLEDAFISSLFGIDPITISYFGSPEINKINQLKSGGSVSSIIYQIVELTNYNKYLPLYTFNPKVQQSWGELYIPLNNLSNNININIIAFRNDVNDDINININDITTLFGVLDNLENLGLTPFTFGTIIFIGLTLGFIMVLIKILK